MKPGAGRNAVDCALLDLAAKQQRTSVAALLGLAPADSVMTCYTLSLDRPEAMADRAAAVPRLPILKLKLGGDGDAARMRAVRAARPDARLVADANEAWRVDMLDALLGVAAECRVELIEQPLPVGEDGALQARPRAVPICADESFHTRADLDRVAPLYDAVNIKLDKTGGLTEALVTLRACRERGLDVMLGCMVGTSLAMAPALLLAGAARWVDLDGPLLLAADRPGGLAIRDGLIRPPGPGLWG
jgi:L-alanine-DL-glutamate epimerase-like enolase superfamily enzyme